MIDVILMRKMIDLL